LLTSSILLPAMLVGWHTLMFRMRGKGEYQDLDIDVVVANSTTMDAILD